MQILEPLVVAGVKAVFSEHLEFALRDLLGFLQLHWVELHNVGARLLALHVLLHACFVVLQTQTLASLGCLLVRLLLRSAALLLLSAVLLGDFIFHDVDRTAFELLSDLLLLSLPSVLNFLAAVSLVLADNLILVLSIEFRHKLQVKERVVEHFEMLELLGLGLFNLDFKLLVWPDLFFFNEVCRRLDQTDFVIQRGWPYDRRVLGA